MYDDFKKNLSHAKDPNSTSEELVRAFFFFPSIVNSNPAWILTKLSGQVSQIVSNMTPDEIDAPSKMDFDSVEDAKLFLEALSDVSDDQFEKLMKVWDERVGGEEDFFQEIVTELQNSTLDEKTENAIKVRIKRFDVNRSIREIGFLVKTPEGAKKILQNPYVSDVILFYLYAVYPDLTKKHPNWANVKNAPNAEIAKDIATHGSDFSLLDDNKPLPHASILREYSYFLYEIAEAMQRVAGNDLDLEKYLINRVRASIKNDPRTFSEKFVMVNVPYAITSWLATMWNDANQKIPAKSVTTKLKDSAKSWIKSKFNV